jgi:hypothetical protein
MEGIVIHPSILEIFRQNLDIKDLIRLSHVNRWFYYKWITSKRVQECLGLSVYSLVIKNIELQYHYLNYDNFCYIQMPYYYSFIKHDNICYPCWLSLTRTDDFINEDELIHGKIKRYWKRFVERRKIEKFQFEGKIWYKIPIKDRKI